MNNSSLIPETPTSGSNAIYVFSAINFIGLVLNTLVIVAAVRPRVIPGKAPLAFLVSQLVSDWICSFFESFTWIIDRDWPVPDNALGTFACKLWYARALAVAAYHTTYSNLVLLTVERFVAVVYPTKHDKFTPRLIGFSIFLNWSTGLIRAWYRLLTPDRQGNHCILVPVDTKIWSFVVLFWTLYIPVAVVAVLNGKVLCVLKGHRKIVKAHSTNSAAAVTTNAPSRHTKVQRQLTISVCITCLASLLLSSPLAITNVLMSLNIVKNDVKGLLFTSLSFISTSFYTVNPILCMALIISIRKELLAMLRCRRRGETELELQTRRTHLSSTVYSVQQEAHF